MTYYDRFVENPDAALRDIAARRNLSPEELLDRIGHIYAEARSGKHLSFGEATRWLEAPEEASGEIRSHIDSCRYCQSLLDGLAPARLGENVGLLQKEIAGRGTARSRFFLKLGARIGQWNLAEVALGLTCAGVLAAIAVPAFKYRIAFDSARSLGPPALTASAAKTSEIAG